MSNKLTNYLRKINHLEHLHPKSNKIFNNIIPMKKNLFFVNKARALKPVTIVTYIAEGLRVLESADEGGGLA